MKTVREMAKEAGFLLTSPNAIDDDEVEAAAPCITAELERFAALVRAQALEEAARECDSKAWQHPNAAMLGPEMNASACATAIRALLKP